MRCRKMAEYKYDYDFIKTEEAKDIALLLMKKAQLEKFYNYSAEEVNEIFTPLYDVEKANQVYIFCLQMEDCKKSVKEAKSDYEKNVLPELIGRSALYAALKLKIDYDPDYVYEQFLALQEKFNDEVLYYETDKGELGDGYILNSLKK